MTIFITLLWIVLSSFCLWRRFWNYKHLMIFFIICGVFLKKKINVKSKLSKQLNEYCPWPSLRSGLPRVCDHSPRCKLDSRRWIYQNLNISKPIKSYEQHCIWWLFLYSKQFCIVLPLILDQGFLTFVKGKRILRNRKCTKVEIILTH